MGKHYVPQEYLRGFASDAGRRLIWMFDKVQGSWVEASIKNVAQSKAFYPAEIEENLNTLVENPANVALNDLRAGAMPDPESGGALLTYIAVMLTRVPRKRLHAMSIIPGVIDSVVQNARAEISKMASTQPGERVEALLADLDRVEIEYRANALERLKNDVDDPWPTNKVVTGIHDMCWRLVTLPDESPLVTSDNPAYFFSGLGIGRAESEITFPIGPKLALLGSRQGEAGAVVPLQGKRPLAKEINRRIAVGATRFIFSSRPYRWVSRLVLNGETELKRIRWNEHS